MQLIKGKKLESATYEYNSSTDFIGAISSTLCMVHCLITPLLFAVQACSSSCSISCSEISPSWWKMVDFAFLLVSLMAIFYTAKSTSLKYMPFFLYTTWIALALLIVNNLVQLISLPHALIYVPAISLMVLHLYNRKYCRCAEDSCCA